MGPRRELVSVSAETHRYVSGYWSISGNQKRSGEHYNALLPRSLDLIRGQSLVFFTSGEAVSEWVSDLCAARSIQLQLKERQIEQLPAWRMAEQLVECCRRMQLDSWSRPDRFCGEKGMIHYWRDLKGSGAETFHRMHAIWLSKPALAAECAQEATEDRLVWIDATVSRFNSSRNNWRFWLTANRVGRLSHYGSQMRRLGRQLPLNASYLSAPRTLWPRVRDLFAAVAEAAYAMPYGNDAETLFSECVQRHPEWFHCIGMPYSRLKGPSALKARLQDAWRGVLETR
jgi:hypothetical protein